MKYVSTLLIILAIFIAPITAGRNTPGGDAAVGILAAAALVVVILDKRSRKINLSLSSAAFVGFLVLALMSTVTTESLGASISRVLVFFSFAFLYSALLIALSSRPARTAVILSIAASGAVLGAMGVLEYTTYSYGGTWRVFATFVNPGFFGGFLVVVIPVTLGLYLATEQRVLAIAAAGTLILECTALLLTGTRFAVLSAFGAAAVFLIPAALMGLMKRPQWMRLAVVAVLLVPLAFGASKPTSSRVAHGTEQAHSGNFRVVTWKATAKMAMSNPILGTGPGTFQIAFPRYAEAGYTRMAHQGYLQAASECGIPAALALSAALILMLIEPAIRGLRNRKRVKDTQPSPADDIAWSNAVIPLSTDKLLLWAAIGSVSGFLARNLLDSDFYVAGVAIPFLAAAALAYHLSGKKPREIRLNTASVITIIVITVCASILLGMFAAAYSQAEQAKLLISEGYMLSALDSANTAVKLNPWNADYRFRKALILASDPEQLNDAVDVMKSAIRLEPTRAKYRYNLGHIYLAQANEKKALDMYKEAMRLDPHSPNLMLAVADVYEQLGDKRQAMDMYHRLTRLELSPYATLTGVPELVEPSYAYAHFAIGNDLLPKDPAGALKEYEKVIKRLNDREKNSLQLQAMTAAGAVDAGDEKKLTDLKRDTYLKMADASKMLGNIEQEQKYREKAEE